METTKGRLTHRQRQALETQRLIVDASRDLFLREGYGATSIEAVAEQAGVAVSTVYALFKNKRGLLRAIREAWHLSSGQRDIYQDALAEDNPARRLDLAAHATRRQWETGAAMLAIYRSAAAVDAAAAAELAQSRAGRRANLGRFVATLEPSLRPDLSLDQAMAIFQALTLPEIYEELVEQGGWAAAAYEAWLAGSLKWQLLPRYTP